MVEETVRARGERGFIPELIQIFGMASYKDSLFLPGLCVERVVQQGSAGFWEEPGGLLPRRFPKERWRVSVTTFAVPGVVPHLPEALVLLHGSRGSSERVFFLAPHAAPRAHA